MTVLALLAAWAGGYLSGASLALWRRSRPPALDPELIAELTRRR